MHVCRPKGVKAYVLVLKALVWCTSNFGVFVFSFSLLNHLQDESDVVFKAVNGKWRAVVVEISRMHKTGRAVLVGTTSVEQSDELSQLLQEAGITHEVSLPCHLEKSFLF